MLLATPYLPFDGVSGNNGPPRVISEIRKSSPVIPREQIRPRISGDLLVICVNEKRWWPRRVMVRGGQLLVGSAPGEGAPGGLRLPLRHLSLAAGPLPNSLALFKGQNIVLTLQTASERAFDLWVKTIAIELIRQTPLEAVKYLDILTLADCWTRKKQDCEKDWNFNYVKEPAHPQCSFCTNAPQKAAKIDVESPKQQPPPPPPPPQNDERNVEVLFKRCQNSENYVPVKDKLVLFESLCRLGRKVRSTEDVSVKINMEATKRAASMHDLSNCNGSTSGVRQMCKYFENKTDQPEAKYGTIHRPNRRLIHSDSQLHNVNKNMYRYNSEFQNISSV